MTETLHRQIAGLGHLLDIEREAREATTPAALAFVMVNRTRLVLPCDMAAAWTMGATGIRVAAVSAVSDVDQNGPFAQWLIGRLRKQAVSQIMTESGSWSEAPTEALWCPLPGGPGGFVLLRHLPWQEADKRIAERLAATFAHASKALGPQRIAHNLWMRTNRRRILAGAAALMLLLAMLPVRQSAVAPATVVASKPLAITAPVDGIIAEVVVQPYDAVTADQPLVRFDSTQARGRLQLARNSERVAAADLLKTRQRAFSDADASASLSQTAAQLDLHRSEAAFAQELLDRTQIKAERSGIVLFNDPQEWTGKPVTVGERIMTLADPAQVMLQISLPADDAFLLKPGAEVAFYLNIEPLRQIDAALTHVAYEAKMAPEGFLAYRMTADFAKGEALPRIGLKGIATVYGERVSLARFLFRKPLAALRRQLRL
ncbi:MAG: HlyD family efflux transporter periplasmic adaptor subunit [Alphaproteobacteria bacterium]|nr:HlyD family efflux transporter periplasmic adaptor subunit [Alphaproteobacteria bacterium]